MRSDVIKSIIASLLFLSGSLVIISFLGRGYVLNAKIRQLVLWGFGYYGLLVPLILFTLASFFVDAIKFRFKSPWVLIGLVGLLLSLSSFASLFCWRSEPFTQASRGGCGGMAGYRILNQLNTLVSFPGSVVVIIVGLAVSAMLVSNVPLNSVLVKISELIVALKTKISSLRSSKIANEKDQINTPGTLGIGEDDLNAASRGDTDYDSEAFTDSMEEPQIRVLPAFSEPQGDRGSHQAVEGDSHGLTSIAPNLPYADRVWQLPPLSLLDDLRESPPDAGNTKAREDIIEKTLRSFGINSTVKNVNAGPSVTQYALETSSGTKISKIVNLQNDLALALASPTGSVRIEAPIPGKSLVGIEVPNYNRVTVSFKSLLISEAMKSLSSRLASVLGKNVAGEVYAYDIAKMPHLLVAGATGSGKSVFLHALMFSILYRATPQECKFILVDPKRVEFTHYNGIPHLLTPVITDVENASSVFKWAIMEMERRYKLFENARARNIDAYNEKSGFQALPYIVILVDELGEIMVSDPAAVEKSIIRIAQLARATGIHLVLSVQRPSTNVITGLIKANIPCRIAFNVSSQIDSRVIIDQPGAEKLLGMGDMLFVPPDASKPTRLQGALVTEGEVTRLVSYLKDQGVAPEYKEDILSVAKKSENGNISVSAGGGAVDDLFDEAMEVCVSAGKASASLLQRRLSIGYARAARILDELEAKGLVSSQKGSQPREILINSYRDSALDEDDTGF